VLTPLRTALGAWRPQSAPDLRDGLGAIVAAWPEIVGPATAGHSRPAELTDGVLLVVVSAGAWGQQLAFLGERILAEIAALAGAPGVRRLRFRVGRVNLGTKPRAVRRAAAALPAAPLDPAASPAEHLAHFRRRVEAARRAAQASCPLCGAPRERGDACAPCDDRARTELTHAAERLLFEAPWLDEHALRSQLPGLGHDDVRAVRRRLLARWRTALARVERTKRVGEYERHIAQSYVVLQSGVAPDRIAPETIRNLFGDELAGLLFPSTTG
jgi:hypothetical protein